MFKKYSSIENHYNEKFINMFLEMYPELKDETYTITEKIHGANISFLFEPDTETRIASRSGITDTGFYGINNVINNYKNVFEILQKYVDGNKETITSLNIFGEFFGANIQKGVDYGKEKRILFFDMAINEQYISQYEFLTLMNDLNLTQYLVPIIDIVDGLDNALNIFTKFDSKLSKNENNIAEGIVIKPYNNVYTNGHDIFYIKKKNDSFLEKQKSSHIKEPMNENISTINKCFLEYITDNRLNSVFSKHDIIKDKKDIGKYIALFINDAKEDFLKEYDVTLYSDKELKAIFNVGKKPFELLSKYL
jgi:Rnl2 family RNA ligase